MNNSVVIHALLNRVVSGDLKDFDQFAKYSNIAIFNASQNVGRLVLTGVALREVLSGLIEKQNNPNIVQKWASFMIRGYLETQEEGPVNPIVIEYETEKEEAISSVLARLDELGDIVDGVIENDEVSAMMAIIG